VLPADPLRLAQILSNLLTNAAKYTDPGGAIRLRTTSEAEQVTISISDTGVGLATDALSNIFVMFSQVQASRARSEGGLGIGLALAKGLVKLHGGDIEARSDGLGKGSEFTVRLPRRNIPNPRQPDAPSDVGVRTNPRRVLIADDNRDAAESLALLLRLEGHEVTVVHNGREAVATFNTLFPEVAVLDIGMPEINGYEVARQLRQQSSGRPVMLIAVTGWGQEADKSQALAAGFNHHFTKPIQPQELIVLLRSDTPIE
jgi:CheY-like chemotaxis protein